MPGFMWGMIGAYIAVVVVGLSMTFIARYYRRQDLESIQALAEKNFRLRNEILAVEGKKLALQADVLRLYDQMLDMHTKSEDEDLATLLDMMWGWVGNKDYALHAIEELLRTHERNRQPDVAHE